MSFLANLLRGRRTQGQQRYYGGGNNAGMLSLRDMLFKRAGRMPYAMGAHVLRSNSLSPNAQANMPANMQANLPANMAALQANMPAQANVQANVPANVQANVPAQANVQANVPAQANMPANMAALQANLPAQANVQANVPANVQANVPANVQANVPAQTKAPAPVSQAPARRTVTVVPGDTLSGISQRELGKASRWSEIYALNRAQISNPDLIYPGQVFVMPLAGNNNAPVNVPNNLPSVPNNVPADPTKLQANLPAKAPVPGQANAPANVPAQANAPANVPANTAALANQAVLKMTGLLGMMKPKADQAAPEAGGANQANQAVKQGSQLPPALAELAQQTPDVGPDPRAAEVAALARQSLIASNPEFARTAQGQELVETYTQLVASTFHRPPEQRKPRPTQGDYVEMVRQQAEEMAWESRRASALQSAERAAQVATQQAQLQAQTQQQTPGEQQRGGMPLPGTPAYETAYARNLATGVSILQRAGLKFGRADNQAKGKFDATYWAVKSDAQYGAMLEWTGSGLPHNAIDEMFSKVSKWSMDCAEFVQAANLYAQRQTLGADAFDRKYSSAKLTFRVHGSAGVNTKTLYHKEAPGSRPVAVTSQGKREVEQPMGDILKTVPAGSRVMWTNPYAPTTSAWLNENSVKLSDDLFAAHPMGTLSERQIMARLHRANGATSNKASKVFLRQIEVYYQQ